MDHSKSFQVETNACDYVVGVVLYQDGKHVAFESKKLDLTYGMYPIQENEVSVVIHVWKS